MPKQGVGQLAFTTRLAIDDIAPPFNQLSRHLRRGAEAERGTVEPVGEDRASDNI